MMIGVMMETITQNVALMEEIVVQLMLQITVHAQYANVKVAQDMKVNCLFISLLICLLKVALKDMFISVNHGLWKDIAQFGNYLVSIPFYV